MRGWRIDSTHDFRKTLVITGAALVLVDVALILVSVGAVLLREWGYLETVPDRFLITHDGGYGEIFSYLKWLAIVVLCAFMWRKTWSALFAGFGVVFAVVLLDDMLQIHEKAGTVIALRLGLLDAFGLRNQDFGELLVWAMLGTVILAALVLGFRLGRRQDRGVGLALLAAFFGLIFCGVAMDMAAVYVSGAWDYDTVQMLAVWGLHLAEDGGEMIFGSLALAIAAGALASLRARPKLAPLTFEAPEPRAVST